MDKTAVRNSIERVLAAREASKRAEETARQSSVIAVEARSDLRKAIGQLGTDMGNQAAVGVVYKGALYKVDPFNRSGGDPDFSECPVVDPIDVSNVTDMEEWRKQIADDAAKQIDLAKEQSLKVGQSEILRFGRTITIPNMPSEASKMPVPVAKSALPPEIHASKKSKSTNTKDAPNG